jgi:hypothetical protein
VPARRFIGAAGAARTVSPEAQLDVKAIASQPLASSTLDHRDAAFLPPRVGEVDNAARRRDVGTVRPRVLKGPSDHILPAMQSETARAVVVPV